LDLEVAEANKKCLLKLGEVTTSPDDEYTRAVVQLNTKTSKEMKARFENGRPKYLETMAQIKTLALKVEECEAEIRRLEEVEDTDYCSVHVIQDMFGEENSFNED
jgi:hypothetical protein